MTLLLGIVDVQLASQVQENATFERGFLGHTSSLPSGGRQEKAGQTQSEQPATCF